MTDSDPLETQRDIQAITAALASAGFDDAHEIGRGGFGVVYRCVQRSLDRTVAVKVLTSHLDEENKARFFREQHAMGRLTGHPNIVNALHVGCAETEQPYIVMQYHPRDSLDKLIRRSGPRTVEEALRLGVKLAGAVESAHRLGILHRDIKPANILLTNYGEPALTDFGIAHIVGGFQTATGTVTGSPAFTAPEVLRGEPPTPASDIYSLGATLFCAITAHAAFERRSGEHVVAQFLRITTQRVPDLRELGIPEDVCLIIERAMASEPHDRPTTATELGEALRSIQHRHGFPVDDMAVHAARGDPEPGQGQVSGDLHLGASAAPDPSGGASSPRQHPSKQPAVRHAMGNIPLELTSFVGRRHELTETTNLLSGSRLVTLTGIGGVGKTRLAIRAATESRKAFPDGVWLIELGELRDESILADVVAAGLGLRDQSARAARDVITDFLDRQRLLLVLDNCEQVVNAVAALAEILLQNCPQLRILVTSREPLDIGGEAVLRVPPLTMPDLDDPPSLRVLHRFDAVTLFAERAAAAVPGFELAENNRITVARICKRLDGLPLPIELAAARLRAMSAEQVLQRLTDQYSLLTRGSRGAPTRQQTLQLCIDWSYELCTRQEQRVWAQLSVFAGSFELDAAEQICSSRSVPNDLLDSLTSLVDKSILIREETGTAVRFRMLETLRDYGRIKVQQISEDLELRRRHRDWYRQFVLQAESEWISSRQLHWITRLAREQPNLREAMEFCLSEANETEAGLQIGAALFPFWLSRGLLGEGRRWLDRFLTHDAMRASTERVKALFAASVLADVQGDLEAAKALIREGRELTKNMHDRVADARISSAEGLLALFGGDLPRACARMEKALDVFVEEGELSLQVWGLVGLGFAYELQGNSARAVTCHQQVLEITEAREELVYRSQSLWAMGIAVWKDGDTARAASLIEQSLRLTRRVDDPVTATLCLEALAWVASDENRQQRATVLMGAAEALGWSIGSSAVLFPTLLTHHQDCELRSRHVLGSQAFDTAQQLGRAFDFAEAVAYALGEKHDTVGIRTSLTKRELQVAELVAQGLTNKAVAAKLVISQRTAQGHVEHILVKLGYTSRTQIAAWFAEQARIG